MQACILYDKARSLKRDDNRFGCPTLYKEYSNKDPIINTYTLIINNCQWATKQWKQSGLSPKDLVFESV